MFKLFKTILLLVLCNVAVAQSYHFVYIENTKKEWFTIKLNDRIYESIGKNFITIPKLENGNYTLIVNTQTAKESIFSITINGDDKGYRIKQNDTKEVELFNINSFNTVIANAISKEVEKQTDVVAIKPAEDTKIDEPKQTPAITVSKKVTTAVVKIYSKKNNEGVDEIYIDGKDTIAIYLPKITVVETPKAIIEEGVIEAPITSTGTAINTERNTNINCKQFAEEIDVKNFTIAVQAELKVKDRLKVANNYFKEKCYTVNQIKRLSSLFINSNGKFVFFKQAQQSISDIQNFSSLETELTDTNIKEEFKAFVKQL
ncbi:MAG: DUF4476 domain-containing protein [Bacteroidetes bacterium]|nr:DUF4476 domain-containing protein [Bacteroidota bacterium]